MAKRKQVSSVRIFFLQLFAGIIPTFQILQITQTNSYATIVEYKLWNSKKIEYSLNDVCYEQGPEYATIVDRKSFLSLNCTGRTVFLSEFCKKKAKDEGQELVRGFIQHNNVICQYASRALLAYQCESSDYTKPAKPTKAGSGDPYCIDKFQGCYELQKIYAINLKIQEHFLSSTEDSKMRPLLTCEFGVEGQIAMPAENAELKLIPELTL